MQYLTDRQRDVLAFIERRLHRDGVAPTLAEIAAHFGFSSTATAQKHVNLLVKKGFLERDKHQKRGLRVVLQENGGESVLHVPLVGTVAAGSPIENFGEFEPTDIPRSMIGDGEHVVLQVDGLSMVGDGIHDGDRIVVRKTAEARAGDTVVALVDGEATLKRFFPEIGGTVRLLSANPEVPPIVVAAPRVELVGVLVGLLRRY